LTYFEQIQHAESQAGAAPADPAAKPGDPPAADPNEKHRFGDIELTGQEIKDLIARKAAEDSRKATVPATPAEYRLDLPTDFVMPQGAEFKWQTADPVMGPLLREAQALAHAQAMDQPTFSKWLSLYAASQIQEQATINRVRDAEVAKLGTSAPIRVDAVTQWARGMVGDRLAKPLAGMMVTAAHVEAFEALMQRFVNQGGGSYSGAKREPNQPQTLPQSEIDKMSYAQRKDYAERMTAAAERQRR
jgi:hypothetical protein